MEFTSSPENIIDSLFENIWSKLKRKGSPIDIFESKVIKGEETGINVNNAAVGSSKCSQTDDIPYINYFDSMTRSLSCVVCQDLCIEALQCQNGHLLCSNCYSLLVDQRKTVCPICRISLKENVTRSLITEHLIRDMPDKCPKCSLVMQKSMIKPHILYNCSKRKGYCKYKIFGCQWNGYVTNIFEHDKDCVFKDKVTNQCLDNSELYVAKTVAAVSNDSLLLKGILEQIRHSTHFNSIKLHKIGLRFLGKEINTNMNKIFIFGNHLFNEGLKIRLRLTFDTTFFELNYCISGNKSIVGDYLFFLRELKGNYVNFEIQDNLRNYHFTAIDTWTNWFRVYVTDPTEEFLSIVPDLEGRCVHIGLILLTNTTMNKVSDKESDQWRDLVNDVLSLDSIDRQIEQSEAMLNQLGALRGYNVSEDSAVQVETSDDSLVMCSNTILQNNLTTSNEIQDAPQI